jgi:hypothetical protein
MYETALASRYATTLVPHFLLSQICGSPTLSMASPLSSHSSDSFSVAFSEDSIVLGAKRDIAVMEERLAASIAAATPSQASNGEEEEVLIELEYGQQRPPPDVSQVSQQLPPLTPRNSVELAAAAMSQTLNPSGFMLYGHSELRQGMHPSPFNPSPVHPPIFMQNVQPTETLVQKPPSKMKGVVQKPPAKTKKGATKNKVQAAARKHHPLQPQLAAFTYEFNTESSLVLRKILTLRREKVAILVHSRLP